MDIPQTRGARPIRHKTPCKTCDGVIKTQPDPDERDDLGPVDDMTYCTGCGEIFSPWTMPYWYQVQKMREARK